MVELVLAVDALTLVVSLLVKVVGFPLQLRVGRTAPGLALLMLGGYLTQVTQAALSKDWTLVASQGLGILMSGALLVQSLRRSADPSVRSSHDPEHTR